MLTLTLGICACGRRGTLIDNCCGFCADAATSATVQALAPQPMTVGRALALLLAELAEEQGPAPLSQRLTLAAVAADLCRLAGEPVPVAVLAALDDPTHAPPRRLRRRGEPVRVVELEPA
jgi:hypothetical protein